MPRFNLTIDLDNDAFHVAGNGHEVIRILATSTAKIPGDLFAGDSQRLRDFNGNTVGHWEVTE